MSVSPALEALAETVGLASDDPYLVTALTHSSYAAEHGGESNERLEFLGDAVVDLAIADVIFHEYPELNEGTGSLVRSQVVNEATLAERARALGVATVLRIGRGVAKERGAERPSILADAFEAIVAALYLRQGFVAARAFVVDQLATDVARASKSPQSADPKTQLLQWASARQLGSPTYEVSATGPSHDVTFVATVRLGERVARGEGRSKKVAEANAATILWGEIDA